MTSERRSRRKAIRASAPRLIGSTTLALPILAFLLLGTSCTRVATQTQAEVADEAPLPIDGTWQFGEAEVRIENGKMYALSTFKIADWVYPPDALIARSFRQLGPTQFACEWVSLQPEGVPGSTVAIPIELTTPRTLEFRKLLLSGPDLKLTRSEQAKDVVSRNAIQLVTDPNPVVQVEAGRIRRPISTELIEIPAGSTIEITRTRTLEREINLVVDFRLQSELSVDALGVLKDAIRLEIGAKVGGALKDTETRDYKIRLDGNVSRKYKLVWYELSLPGEITFETTGGRRTAPFRFREAEEFEAVAVL